MTGEEVQVVDWLVSLGGPGIAILGLLWDRRELKKELAEERKRNDQLVEMMLKRSDDSRKEYVDTIGILGQAIQLVKGRANG